MATDRKSSTRQLSSPEGQATRCEKSTTLPSQREPESESASATGTLMKPSEAEGAKASPPRLVRREKKASSGCGDKREDGAAHRSDYIQLPQLEKMLESGRLGTKAGKDRELEMIPPKRLHESPKRKEVLERRIIPPPGTELIDALRSSHPQVVPEDVLGNMRSTGGVETKDTYTDSGYSTLEETLALFDRDKFLHQRMIHSEIKETSGTALETEPSAVISRESSLDKSQKPIPDLKHKEPNKMDIKNEERSQTASKIKEAEGSHYSEKAFRRESVGSDNEPLSPRELRPGYAPVKAREEKTQEKTKMLDSSKLEDIRLLSTAILEYLQSRNSDDHVSDESLKDESNYAIFKNADVSNPPLPQKKHRVLPSPVKVGQTLKSVAAYETGIDRQIDADDVQASTLGSHLAEPTHMNWEEVLREAKMLGIPLSRSSSRCRSSSDRRSSMSSSAASSDISHQSSPCSSPIRTTKRKPAKEEGGPSKDRDQKSVAANKLSIFNLQGWLSKLRRSDRSTSKDSSSLTASPKRRQHLSCSSDRNSTVSGALTQVQRRSLSASATQRNRINLSVDSCTCSPGGNNSNKSPSYRQTSSLTYDISASGSRGSSNSFLSTSMIASPSISSLGSVFSRSSRGSCGNHVMLSASSHDHGIGLHSSSPLSSSASPMSPSCGGGGGGGGGGGQRTPATLGISQTYSRRTSKSPTRNSRNFNLMKTIDQLKDCGWYWGSLGWEEARMKLDSAPDGSFLLRDSSDDRYLFSLSFRSQGKVHHTRIEHYKGTFNFTSQPSTLASTSIVELIDRAMTYSQTHPYVSCLQPRPPGLNPIPIQLLYPVSRSTLLPSLQQLCRSAIVRNVRIDDIDRLPITDRLKNYVRISQQI